MTPGFLVLVALIVGPTVHAQDLEFRAGVDAFYQRTRGTMKFDERPIASDRIGIEDDLGHHHRELQIGLHAQVSTGAHRVRLGYERWRMAWNHSILQELIFDGQLFPANVPVRNRLSADRAQARYDARVVEEDLFQGRIGVRADYWVLEQVMDTPSVGIVDDHLGTLVLEPVMTATAGSVSGVRLDLELSGAVYRVLRHSVRTYEIRAELRWTPAEFLEIGVGYRFGRCRFSNVDSRQHNEVAWQAFGPLASIDVRF